MAQTFKHGIFPSQAVPDVEKADSKYGMQVAKAIEAEWFKNLSIKLKKKLAKIDS